jgi:4-carboxymuconolactone decarboxylase
MDDQERTRRGKELRDEILGARFAGDAGGRDPRVYDDFESMALRFAWAETWSRQGITRRMRCAATISMLIALDRPAELELHIEAGLANGLSVEEIKELILHAAVYTGMPRANAAMRVAAPLLGRALDERDGGSPDP